MEQESSAGIDYLKALKQGSPHLGSGTPSAAPGQERHSVPGSGEHSGPEQRRSPRYKCEGSAEIRACGSEARTWATFTDVSQHGCYVEAQVTWPVGSILRMKLAANNISLETKGNVRVTYPHLGMGVAFVEMSDDNQARLRQLLASLSQPSTIMGTGIIPPDPTVQSVAAPHGTSDPAAVVLALAEYFEHRQILVREDFLTILRKNQK